ncbi:MAG: hypothetical protein HC834_06080, partial [Rhodospirillales bacterium]|nr:hypothetical protein [Rhodospirillales bacterium]
EATLNQEAGLKAVPSSADFEAGAITASVLAESEVMHFSKARHCDGCPGRMPSMGWQPQLPLELALLDSLKPEVVTIEAAPQGRNAPRPAAPNIASPVEAPEPAAQPGQPALLPVSAVADQWNRALHEMGKLNETSPGVMQHFRPVRVDGNVVVLATDNSIFYERVQPYPEKIRIVERALRAVFNLPLRVQVTLGGAEAPAASANDPLLSTVLAQGGKVSGKIRSKAKPSQENEE